VVPAAGALQAIVVQGEALDDVLVQALRRHCVPRWEFTR
jgi:hypothetical protein